MGIVIVYICFRCDRVKKDGMWVKEKISDIRFKGDMIFIHQTCPDCQRIHKIDEYIG